MMASRPDIQPGKAVFTNPDNGKVIAEFRFPEKMEAAVEEVKMDDPPLLRSWGKSLYRLNLTAAPGGKQASFHFRVIRK